MTVIVQRCDRCGQQWQTNTLGPLPPEWVEVCCPHCGRPLATLNTHRIPGWRLELLRDEHSRNQRAGRRWEIGDFT